MSACPIPPSIPAPLRHWIAQLPVQHVAKGSVLFRAGGASVGFVIVLAGVVRVQRQDIDGREIVLYRVGPGQACMFSTLGLLARRPYPADGVAEDDVALVIVQRELFAAWMEDEAFRRFVFHTFAERIEELVDRVEALAFCGVAERLAERLLLLASDGCVQRTHQALAAELGSTRESVSKALKLFELRGWVKLGRGQVFVRDAKALEALAAQCKAGKEGG